MNIKNLQFLFKPSYWIMSKTYSKEVDEIVNKFLDNFEMTYIDGFTCKLGEVTIWTK